LLAEGEGRGFVLYFDAFAGLAGDMILASLLDLGVPLLVVERALAALPLDGFHLHRGHAHKNAIVATSFEVHLEAPQPQRDYATIDAMLVEAPLDPAVRDLARRIFRTLGESEALVHRMPLESVHFHEVGAVDAIVDIVGAAAALCYLDAELVCSPLPMGRGFVRADHGYLPLPAPAVVHCLRGLPTYGVDLEAELVTPTGAAIVATAATRFSGWPSMAPLRVGLGAGTRDLPDRPNLLRAVLGRPTERESLGDASTHVLVEANVDDLTGELAGHAISQLLEAGALDAWASPVTMKKGRPGLVLSALVERARLEAVESALLRETTTIGLRRQAVGRTERPRRTVTVRTRFGELRVKLSEGGFGAPQIKPEFDDCVALAEAAHVPVREVLRAAFEAAWRDVDPQE
jgi:pyridinium-3,5-bisthiocarboxylic acid mononucleotide nickel chelatase